MNVDGASQLAKGGAPPVVFKICQYRRQMYALNGYDEGRDSLRKEAVFPLSSMHASMRTN